MTIVSQIEGVQTTMTICAVHCIRIIRQSYQRVFLLLLHVFFNKNNLSKQQANKMSTIFRLMDGFQSWFQLIVDR